MNLVAKVWPDVTTNYRYETVTERKKTGNARKFVLAATCLIVWV